MRKGLSIFLYLVLTIGLVSCAVTDPASDVPLKKAPPEVRTFFQGLEDGILYAYITAEGEIFIYRRDLDQFGWITLPQFRQFVAHAKSRGGYLIRTLEDGNLKQTGGRDAFNVTVNAHMNTQDPVYVLPLVKQESAERRK